MLDSIDIVCPLLRSNSTATIFTLFGYFGHSSVAGAIGLALLAYGYFYNRDRDKWGGLLVLVAVILAIGLAESIRHVIAAQPGFRLFDWRPSTHTSAAVALASALSAIFPNLSPIFFVFATFAGLSRLYLHAESTLSVIGGAVIGFTVVAVLAKHLLSSMKPVSYGAFRLATWVTLSMFAVGMLGFFYAAENGIARHAVLQNRDLKLPVIASLDFGTAEGRSALGYGWSDDEAWEKGKRSLVWAVDSASEVAMNLPSEQDYRFRFNAFPYDPNAGVCQRVEVRINHMPAAHVHLIKGWHWYEFDVSKTIVHPGRNFIQFFYDYAETPKSHGNGQDERKLSVAFDSLQVLPAR